MKKQRNYIAMAAVAGTLLLNTAFGQDATITYDSPYTYHRLITNINLIQLDLASPTTFRVGLGAEFDLLPNLLLQAEYNLEPISMFNDEAIRKSQNQFEAGAIFSFASRLDQQSKMKLRFHTGHSKYKMKLTASVLKQYGLRGGIASFSTPKEHEGGYISYTTAPALYGGLVVMRTRNVMFNAGELGSHDKESRGKFYADVLFAPVISLSDNTNYAAYDGSASTATAATFPDLAKNHLGARIGYMKRSNNDIIPFYSGFEAGIRPGVGTGYYFTLKMAISLGFIEGNGPKGE